MINMVKSSETWLTVEEKLEELKKIVEDSWDKGEWEMAIYGEGIIKTVEESQTVAAVMRNRTNDLFNKINTICENNK